VKQIPLTRGQFALVDDEDFEYINQWKWCAQFMQSTNSFYAHRGYRENGKHKIVSMHRIIMKAADSCVWVDHIDHNTLNNQRSNLRFVNRSESAANRKSHKKSTSKYLGVHWHKDSGKWQASIQKDKKQEYIGIFDDEKIAAIAYNKNALKLHGEFANLNLVC
jgi:hypothetical protein